MTVLIVGLALFLGVHSLSIVAPASRDALAARLGEHAWKGVYSLLSICGFVLLVWGYGLARQSPLILYQPPHWMRHITVTLMLPVFPLLLAPYFPGRIKATLKHPMLVAVKLWTFAHLLANGTLADVLLFGSFLVWAIADRISLKRRPARALHGAPPRAINDVLVVVIGLALYLLFLFWAHVRLIGVSPL